MCQLQECDEFFKTKTFANLWRSRPGREEYKSCEENKPHNLVSTTTRL